MKLHITPTSPYGRIARIVVHELGLAGRVEIVAAKTRTPGSPYYAVLPSGRVPYLERDDRSLPGLEDSALICRYLDQRAHSHQGGRPRLHLPPETDTWDYGRLEATARSMLDGLAVHVRETRRPPNEQSPTILAHEVGRARRMTEQWEGHDGAGLISHRLLRGEPNMAQIVLYVALETSWSRGVHDWRPHCSALAAWSARQAARPSIAATA